MGFKRKNQFDDALYVGRGGGRHSNIAALPGVFAVIALVVVIWASDAKSGMPQDLRSLLLWIAIPTLSVCALLCIVIILVKDKISKRVFFAVYQDCLIILPTDKDTLKKPDYVRLPYNQIISYNFINATHKSIDEPGYRTPLKFNYGVMDITVRLENGQRITYKTQISNIDNAREWLKKFVAR
jgi:hypothetical protein